MAIEVPVRKLPHRSYYNWATPRFVPKCIASTDSLTRPANILLYRGCPTPPQAFEIERLPTGERELAIDAGPLIPWAVTHQFDAIEIRIMQVDRFMRAKIHRIDSSYLALYNAWRGTFAPA